MTSQFRESTFCHELISILNINICANLKINNRIMKSRNPPLNFNKNGLIYIVGSTINSLCSRARVKYFGTCT